jgi:2-amino-4-hydroxy-6-hydroxymethyldihydropteridine diphosphokinase
MIHEMRMLIGFGGNLGDPAKAFSRALEQIAEAGEIIAVSRLWRTLPVGPSQPDFLNAAAVIEWPGGPRSLLERCRELEVDAGRDRVQERRWGPRILDLDLLLAASAVCRGPALELPHQRFHERRFVLEPSAEVAASWTHPLLGLTIEELAARARKHEPDAIIEVVDFGC